MDFERLIKTEAKRIDLVVQFFLNNWEKDIQKRTPVLKKYALAFKQANIGGKYLRGILVSLGYQIAKGKKNAEILKVAAAYEIFHTSILAHDDIIDQSPTRRGQQSLYKALGGSHHGISQAICLGDLGFFLSTDIISQTNFPAEEKIAAIDHFSKTTMDTALGEMLDIDSADVFMIMKLKTARYTISGPLQLGAILAKADPKLVKKLGEFGENLGVAFQIQDDILGVFGEEKSLGKSNKSDIEEGKNTILIIEALKKGTKSQLMDLKKYYGKGKITHKELLVVREIFKKTGALKYGQDMALEYVKQAKNMISGLTKDQDMSTLLKQFADYLIERSK